MKQNDDVSVAGIGKAIMQMAQTCDAELFALSTDQILAEWRWRWNPNASELGNVYAFFSQLSLYKYRCERWETYHNGSVCVVERVRDKYILPRIKELLEHLRELEKARAEIEKLKQELRDNSTLAARQIVPLELALADARAELERKDKLIEQLQEVLRGVCEKCPCDTRLEDARCKDCDVGAALSAAERGEG